MRREAGRTRSTGHGADSIRISGENLDKLHLLAEQVAAELRKAGGYHVFDDLDLRMPNIQIDIDQDRAEPGYELKFAGEDEELRKNKAEMGAALRAYETYVP